MPEGYDAIGCDATLGLGEPHKMRRPPISRRADPPRGSALDGVRVGSPDGPAVGAGHDGVPAREVLRGRGAGVAAGQHADARKAEFREPLLLTSNCGVAVHDGCEAGRLMAAAAKHRWGPGKSVRLGSEPRDVPALEEVDGRLAREAAAADGGRGKYELLLRYDAAESSRSVATSFVDMVDEPEDPVLPEQRTGRTRTPQPHSQKDKEMVIASIMRFAATRTRRRQCSRICWTSLETCLKRFSAHPPSLNMLRRRADGFLVGSLG
ncbi:hypothetical protein S7711_11436 [Stachybotrys chartarum IBT 7711]|uniref:Uncharacterized protein n=1 Tax=Stachybotrys chartarum (strain CBS 109288 / IBT 7711) TaxID=1280523 RepID=A0A084B7T3_STACB|nr:hypothetical protein S7711_11436 [Stachybotrys chartarum IBT 7711]